MRRNTYIFYLSDNGFMRGEHRIRGDKRFLYEESARVPFIARGPGIPHGESSNDVVVNADLTSTILELSGAQAGLLQDGQSLIPSLQDPTLERGRAILFEAYAGEPILGVRTSRYTYAEWDTGGPQPEKELYDTYLDPYQLINLANSDSYQGVVAELGAELDDLIDCAGESCRGAPTGQLTFTTGGGKNGCVLPPVVARYATSADSRVVGVSFRAGKASLGTDTVAPFEVAVPESALRDELPDSAEVKAEALFTDGRRLASSANLRACR